MPVSMYVELCGEGWRWSFSPGPYVVRRRIPTSLFESVEMSKKSEYWLVLFRRRQDQGERRKSQEVEFVLELVRQLHALWRAGFRA